MSTFNNINKFIGLLSMNDIRVAKECLYDIMLTTQNISIVRKGTRYGFVHISKSSRFVYDPVDGLLIGERGDERKVYLRLFEQENEMIQDVLEDVLELAELFDRLGGDE